MNPSNSSASSVRRRALPLLVLLVMSALVGALVIIPASKDANALTLSVAKLASCVGFTLASCTTSSLTVHAGDVLVAAVSGTDSSGCPATTAVTWNSYTFHYQTTLPCVTTGGLTPGWMQIWTTYVNSNDSAHVMTFAVTGVTAGDTIMSGMVYDVSGGASYTSVSDEIVTFAGAPINSTYYGLPGQSMAGGAVGIGFWATGDGTGNSGDIAKACGPVCTLSNQLYSGGLYLSGLAVIGAHTSELFGLSDTGAGLGAIGAAVVIGENTVVVPITCGMQGGYPPVDPGITVTGAGVVDYPLICAAGGAHVNDVVMDASSDFTVNAGGCYASFGGCFVLVTGAGDYVPSFSTASCAGPGTCADTLRIIDSFITGLSGSSTYGDCTTSAFNYTLPVAPPQPPVFTYGIGYAAQAGYLSNFTLQIVGQVNASEGSILEVGFYAQTSSVGGSVSGSDPLVLVDSFVHAFPAHLGAETYQFSPNVITNGHTVVGSNDYYAFGIAGQNLEIGITPSAYQMYNASTLFPLLQSQLNTLVSASGDIHLSMCGNLTVGNTGVGSTVTITQVVTSVGSTVQDNTITVTSYTGNGTNTGFFLSAGSVSADISALGASFGFQTGTGGTWDWILTLGLVLGCIALGVGVTVKSAGAAGRSSIGGALPPVIVICAVIGLGLATAFTWLYWPYFVFILLIGGAVGLYEALHGRNRGGGG